MRIRLTDQRGQTASEYLGILLLVAVLVAALGQLGLGGRIGGAIEEKICEIAGLGCSGPASSSASSTSAAAPGPGSPAVPVSASAGGPVPKPQPGPAPQAPGWSWPPSAGSHADQLPTDGERPYSPGKKGRGNPVRGNRGTYVDEDGNAWEWARPGTQHGGEHWDVQHPDGSHTNVAPDGTVIGDDNFPNRRRVPKPPPPPPPPSDDPNPGADTAKSVAEGAGALAIAGTILWWAGKAASPACGPFVIVCAVVL